MRVLPSIPCAGGDDRARSKEALRESEAQFRSVAESASDAIISTDAAGRVTFWNHGAEVMFGYTEAEIAGRWVACLVPERYRQMENRVLGLIRAAAAARKGTPLEMHGLRRDGSEFPLELSVATWRRQQQTFYTAIIRDVTERVKLAEQFRQAQKMEAIGRLAGGIAHDFNNLLTAILGYSDLVAEDLGPDHAASPGIAEIRKAGERAAALTRQLLAFSRRQLLQPRPTDLNAAVRELEPMLRRLIGEDVTLVRMEGERLPLVRADRSQLDQVLMNLAVNARDAMPGGGTLMIETGCRTFGPPAGPGLGPEAGPHVWLAVTDTGSGITPEVRSHLFEPFFTTKEQGKGTGLGLSTVYGIVKQSNGHIDVESQPGRTTFRIHLPACDAAREEQADTARGYTSRREHAGIVVLVVDDEDAVRELVTATLRRLGYATLSARHGHEAQLIAERHPEITLLLTDVVMPGMSGPELAQRLAFDRQDLLVLFMTGHGDHLALSSEAVAHRFSFIHKPFSAETLSRHVRQELARRGAGRSRVPPREAGGSLTGAGQLPA